MRSIPVAAVILGACCLALAPVVEGVAPAGSQRRQAYVTLVCNDRFVMGAVALAHSLRAAGATRSWVAMTTDALSAGGVVALEGAGYRVVRVESIANPYAARLPHAHTECVWTKLRAWELHADYDKVVLLDSDIIVLKDIDDLFRRNEPTAAPDLFPPDKFNTGVLVLEPSPTTFRRLATFTATSYDTTDQGFLNAFFSDWYSKPARFRLPYAYNTMVKLKRHNKRYFTQLWPEVRVLHYSGWSKKPWEADHGDSEATAWGDEHLVNLWWSHYNNHTAPA